MVQIDQAKETRPGEELDRAKVEAFVKDHFPGLQGPLTIKQFPSGHSNLTYLLLIDGREIVLRRPPFGTKAKTAHDMGREYRFLKAVKPVYPYVPEVYVYTEDESVIGCPFYLMERLRGVVLRRELPPGLTYTIDQARSLCRRLIEVHQELHAVDYKKIGLENFGKPQGYVRRQVEGWSKRYRAARTPDAPDYEEVMAWLPEKMPGDTDRPGLIHNDYRLDNAMVDPQDPVKIIGVLDWEMATLGDPVMDLGNSLAYWVDPDDPPEMQAINFMPPEIKKGAPTRAEVVKIYEELSGRSIDHLDFYYCFGLFRLAVIAQQIYYRFYHGQTQDQRFKGLGLAVHILEKACRRIIKR